MTFDDIKAIFQSLYEMIFKTVLPSLWEMPVMRILIILLICAIALFIVKKIIKIKKRYSKK